ncbi:dethiobiotin synthase [Eubacterium barkeri]|uniref:ATP-dependent dethiobiotin synthetase BioD n=1 Tax=Eubacterium barkeri TaxID=1528 RepID=A0A1H3CHD4_EUBBA|nr:dethiobiotin synthase [Eubacterium barkeri]SDX53622.1 dethiobiotin synthetase [Eubacterium barkeri]
MGKTLFIAGTGTDVGKTYVSGLLLKALLDTGIQAAYYKPVLSGALSQGGRLIPGDAAQVCQMAGLHQAPGDCVSYCFGPALSPHLAARESGEDIELSKIQRDFAIHKKSTDTLVVEGAGGLITPLTDGPAPLLLTDIILTLGCPVLLVSGSGLGAINHTMLSIHHGQSLGIPMAGVVLNHYDSTNPIHIDNARMIETLSGLPVLARIERDARTWPDDKNQLNTLLCTL